MMASQDDLGMLWYGVTGVSFNPADPAEVMLNTGTAAPLLSDHPRPLVPTPVPYSEPTPAQHTQMLYEPNTGDYITQPEYMYEAYDGYDEDSSGSQVIHQQGTPPITDPNIQPDESPPPLPKSKKPKVHHHPALKLKTPIAYQKDTDLNAIPIMREGMAVCKKCGAIGVKHAFYGKERKFCSLACAREPPPLSQHPLEVNPEKENCEDQGKKVIPVQKVIGQPSFPLPSERPTSPLLASPSKPNQVSLESKPDLSSEPVESPTYLPPTESTVDLEGSFSWADSYLQDPNFIAVPVSSFKHAPMSECWEQMSAGMKVEVACKEEAVTKDAFWVATVIAISGYKAKLRFEGFVDDCSKDFWVDLCSETVHPVGWCATQGRPLIPPRSIQNKYRDWKEFLMKRLTGARTLPTNFMSRVVESQKSRFRPGLNVEVVDKNRIAQMRVATVTEVVGKRLHLKYHGAPPDDNGFWCHEDAPIIHPVGWSREVGHEIVASQSYHEKCIQGMYDVNDAGPDLFVTTPTPAFVRNSKLSFSKGMKLEAIDPLNLSAICVATVMKVLRNNYLMIRIDSYESDNTCSDWFCYHATSPCIFPAGFCEMSNIPLTPPRGCEGQFSWFNYLTKTQAKAAPPPLFNRDLPSHGFEEGMALESADLMDPRLVCVATVKQVKGRLLKVHFDGWESDFDQWIDYQSPDIYPVGWCDMSGYRLEGPKSEVLAPLAPKRKLKGSGRHKTGKRGRPAMKKVGRGIGGPGSIPSSTSTTSSIMRKRGRPPKDKHFDDISSSDSQSHQLRSQNENTEISSLTDDKSSEVSRGRRSVSKRDARRSPRSSSHSNSNAKTLPVRTTRAKTLPTQDSVSDEEDEDVSDETSSGVASLDGNDSSREAWDIDVESCDPPASLTSMPQLSSQDVTDQTELASSCLGEIKVQEFTDLEMQSTLLNDDRIEDAPALAKFGDDIKCEDSDLLGSGYMLTHNLSTEDNFVKSEDSTSKTSTFPGTSVESSDSDDKNDTFRETLSSQSPVVSSTASSEVTAKKDREIVNRDLYIPRLIDGSVKDGSKVRPKMWTPYDVAEFLKTNDCGAYCDNFISQNISGTKLLTLTQNEVMGLTGMKVGPSLKIHDLVQQLLALVNPAQARYQATLLKRGLSFT
ncbi:MBT domain-containing protein 1 [Halocaridina rubra]|uniref:MBT domain-containing protein 1 n=1 Tax=Halocaridina rubra TaxID=373956 RepID=A0AAN8WXQ6_HALRR